MLLPSLVRRRLPIASKVFGVLAIACGVAAALLVRGMEARLAAAYPSTGAATQVVVASSDSTRGTALIASAVRIERMPAAYVPPGALVRLDEAVGRVLVADVAAGEILTRTRVTARAAGPVAALVPRGLRAVAVTVTASFAALRAGDHVDVLAAFGGASPHTESVAEGLEILRVEPASGSPTGGSLPGVSQSGAGGGAKASLLLLVSPDEAGRIAFAQAFASLSVAIVPAEGDQAPAPPEGTSPVGSPTPSSPPSIAGVP